MTTRKHRKRMLVAESDMNRILLSRDINALIGGTTSLVARAWTIPAMASMGTTLLNICLKHGRKRKRHADDHGSWGQAVVDATTLASSLWSALHRKKPTN